MNSYILSGHRPRCLPCSVPQIGGGRVRRFVSLYVRQRHEPIERFVNIEFKSNVFSMEAMADVPLWLL